MWDLMITLNLDEWKRSLLDWGRRFEIFDEIAQGIVYIHQYSRRNNGHCPNSPTSNLIRHVWELWTNSKAVEIIDSSLGGSYPVAKALRCIQSGLPCVQESVIDGPKMSTVVSMLGNDASLPSPKQPALIIKKTNKGNETGSTEGTSSVKEVTLSLPQAC
ncbi:hypothetical protein DITRI_Ditri15bG0053900 [Diplodiscus trichospermus]